MLLKKNQFYFSKILFLDNLKNFLVQKCRVLQTIFFELKK